MLRTLRAFAWMRWRVLLNSLERTGARDRLERFSLAIDQLGPIIATILLVPSALGLAGLGRLRRLLARERRAGDDLRDAAHPAVARVRLCDPRANAHAVDGADRHGAAAPAAHSTADALRRAGGRCAQRALVSSSLPVVARFRSASRPEAPAPAAITLAAGALFVVCLIGLSTLSALLLHLVVRNRRRGELVALSSSCSCRR